MTKLKDYDENQEAKVPPREFLPSGIACRDCGKEMMIQKPIENHPELPLKRAQCGECGWLGWV